MQRQPAAATEGRRPTPQSEQPPERQHTSGAEPLVHLFPAPKNTTAAPTELVASRHSAGSELSFAYMVLMAAPWQPETTADGSKRRFESRGNAGTACCRQHTAIDRSAVTPIIK
jgi:hypothetical protein